MKKSRTLVCTNVLENVKSMPYGSHCQQWYRMGRTTKDEFIMFHPERYSIDNARTQAAAVAMEANCDYLFFIDDDMILHPYTYNSLKNAKADIALAHTYVRGYPFDPMFFKFKKEKGKKKTDAKRLEHFHDWKNFVDEEGLVDCDAVGFACALIRVDSLLKMPPPYFITGEGQTEDVYYCMKLKQYFPTARIVTDTKVPTGHVLSPEVISINTREHLYNYYAKIQPKAAPGDRGSEYQKKNVEEAKDWVATTNGTLKVKRRVRK